MYVEYENAYKIARIRACTLMASAIVLAIIRPNIAYSNGCDVTNHHILYWIRALGIYRL